MLKVLKIVASCHGTCLYKTGTLVLWGAHVPHWVVRNVWWSIYVAWSISLDRWLLREGSQSGWILINWFKSDWQWLQKGYPQMRWPKRFEYITVEWTSGLLALKSGAMIETWVLWGAWAPHQVIWDAWGPFEGLDPSPSIANFKEGFPKRIGYCGMPMSQINNLWQYQLDSKA